MRIEIFSEKTARPGRGWGWRMIEENNRVIASASGYNTEDTAFQAVRDLQDKSLDIGKATVKVVDNVRTRALSRHTSASRQFLAAALLKFAGRTLPGAQGPRL